MVIRHSYITAAAHRRSASSMKAAKQFALGRVFGHVKYIQHRPGEDRTKGGREFFTDTEDQADPRLMRQAIQDIRGNGVVIHKLTLAPEINPADPKEFTREVIQQLEADKGLNLQWWAVIHRNTEHHHVHVVVLPKDEHGVNVRFNKQDYGSLRKYGDQYLERVHPLELREARRQREERDKELAQERKQHYEQERQRRIARGEELPWLHKEIIRKGDPEEITRQVANAVEMQHKKEDKPSGSTGRWVSPIQEEVMSNPVMSLFLIEAGLASELVKSIPLKDQRDLLNEQRLNLETLKLNQEDRQLRHLDPEQKSKDETTISNIGQALEDNRKAQKARDKERKLEQDGRDREKDLMG